jgi:hypothetical protein
MSKANASAKQRRAFVNAPIQPSPAPSTSSTQSGSPSAVQGLTLQQVISLFDRRIVNLESIVKDIDTTRKVTFEDEVAPAQNDTISNLPDIINEFNSRFEMFAQEIGDMKDALLKLQTYTMEVNKMLLEERSKAVDLGEPAVAAAPEQVSEVSVHGKKSRA